MTNERLVCSEHHWSRFCKFWRSLFVVVLRTLVPNLRTRTQRMFGRKNNSGSSSMGRSMSADEAGPRNLLVVSQPSLKNGYLLSIFRYVRAWLRMGRTGPGRLCVIFSRGNCFALVPVLSGVEEDICKLDRIEGEFERDVRPIRRRGGRSVKYFCPFKTFHALAWMWPLCLVERERWRRWTQVLLSMVTPLLSKWRSAEVSL